MEYYLRGDYFQAERLLGNLLREDSRDLEARLMLATLLRHTGRTDEAAAELNVLVRLEGAGKWELEIQRERELLREAEGRNDHQAAQQASRASTDPLPKDNHAA